MVTMVFMVFIRWTAREWYISDLWLWFLWFLFPAGRLFPPRPLAAARACAADHNFPL